MNSTPNLSIAVIDAELSKFTALCYESEEPLPMFSSLIDNRWHVLIDNNHENLPIHDTTIRTSELTKITWIKDYEKKYGKLHKAWFMDANFYFDFESYNKYIESGNIFSCYNCAGRQA
jgi:hypothetical protein